MFLILSWQDLRQLLILKFIEDDYEKILYLIDNLIDYYYLLYVQHSQKTRKNMEGFGENKISKLSDHVKENMIKEVANKQFQSFNLMLVASDDFLVMNKNLTNKDIVIYDNSPKNIFKDYLEVLYI